MRFVLAKYMLTHFIKGYSYNTQALVTLTKTIVHLELAVKVLRVVLDLKL